MRTSLHTLLRKLIRTANGRKRFAMAFIALSIAMLLILAAVQIQSDYDQLLNSKSNQDSVANFLVLNKPLTDQNLGATALTDAEIGDLRRQPFIQQVGLLTPSRFKASIQSASDRFPFYTDIAFESVPDEFIDVTSKDWHWDESKTFVPIIAPNMFLDFYNFQFSFSQNLPQLTQSVVKMIVFRINAYGANGVTTFNGRVVGFSDRISSLLVPQEFMDYGNAHFANTLNTKPSRAIIRTKDPGSPALTAYLKQAGLTTDADKTRFSRYRHIVELVVQVAGATGLVMFVFAMIIFTLFIQLTIASCREEITLLVTLGASPQQLRKFLMKQFFPVNLLIVAIALVLVTILQYMAHQLLEPQHIFLGQWPSVYTLGASLLILTVIWLVNYFTIRRYTTAGVD